MSWFEVETKVKIKNIKDLKRKVKKIANLKKKEIKKDNYFSLTKKEYPIKAFRIRTNGKEHVVNFKKWVKKDWDKNIVVKEEFEFQVKNPEIFLALMKDLGFEQWINKTKNSEIYSHKKYKKLTIELNNVKKLGDFMEIEYLAKKNEINKAKKIIRKTLKQLEINPSQINNTGYTKMLWKIKNEKK
ncbi:class IV adenylate cyclase [Candidatus Pacearchaeota archaeon]|nr:class IV adenylate cyclase [Candidatus Pacearchaeota archaeon]